jgi:glycosyltransferase involved in cell wall biosynthesis
MIVALDAQLAVGTATGIGTYVRDLECALTRSGVRVQPLRAARLDPWRFDRRAVWDQVLLPWMAARSGASVLHAASGTLPLVRTLPTVLTVHDMAWHRAQDYARAYARLYFGALQCRAYGNADAIVCDSAFTATELREITGIATPIEVVHPGVDARFATLERTPAAAPFALVVGTVEPRKNLLVLVEALARVPDLHVVSIGPHTTYAGTVQRRAAELGVADRLDLRGYVTREQADELYRTAAVALIPSRYEGFGYALAEAMCAGVPAIAARSSSLIEVASDTVPLCDPDDVDAWSSAIAVVLADRDAAERAARDRRRASVQRFDWDDVAQRMIPIYQSLVREPRMGTALTRSGR